MPRNFLLRSLFFCLFVAVFSFAQISGGYAAQSASIYLSPTLGTYGVGQTFESILWLKPGGRSVDTVVADITLRDKFLAFESVEVVSPFTRILSDHGFNADTNVLSIRVAADGGVREDTVVARITFRAVDAGKAALFFDSSSRLLSSGQDVPFEGYNDTRYVLSENMLTEEENEDSGEEDGEVEGESNDDSIVADSVPEAVIDGQLVSVENTISSKSVFVGDPPIIIGSSTVDRAAIFIDLDNGLVTGKVRAKRDGTWTWAAPEGLLPGVYHAKVTAVHPDVYSVQDVDLLDIEMVRLDVAKTLFSLSLDVAPESLSIGSKGTLKISIKSEETPEGEVQTQIPARLTYYVEDTGGRRVLGGEEMVTLTGSGSVIKRDIRIPSDAGAGLYAAEATLSLGDEVLTTDRQEFSVGKRSYVTIIVAGIIFLIIIAGVIFWRKKKKLSSEV